MSRGAPTIIERKLAPPPLAERVVARPRLERLIGLLVERYPVVWIAATAGAGKTTAVVQAAAHGARPVAWLTVDATDAAPGRLVTYLEAALAKRLPRLAGTATRALAQRAPHAEAAGLLAEAIGGDPLLVVVDELERLADAPEAQAVLSAFVRYAPYTTRIVLITRREIPLDLGGGQSLGRVAAGGGGGGAGAPPPPRAAPPPPRPPAGRPRPTAGGARPSGASRRWGPPRAPAPTTRPSRRSPEPANRRTTSAPSSRRRAAG